MANVTYSAESLQPGMLLGQPILDDQGRTIVPEGARLTPAHIKRLDRWGVTEVVVNDDSSTVIAANERQAAGQAEIESASQEDRDAMRNIASAVAKRFSAVADNEIMGELKRLSVRNLVLGFQGGTIPGVCFPETQ